MELIVAIIILAVFAQVAAIAGWESREGFDDRFGTTSTSAGE
jgi:hypothetical protein